MGGGLKSEGAMWGGRFEGGPDALFRAFNDSLSVDWRLARQDVAGSIAWARALLVARVLDEEEAATLVAALDALAAEVAEMPEPPLESGAEDVHSWVEARLVERLGSLGKKLHTGRSRNDQVATDLRLWAREAVAARVGEVRAAQRSLVDLADRERTIVMPGYTHLQRAQPILFAHWCLAYVEMLDRDAERLLDAGRRLNLCPLGSAALAGTAYPIDRARLAAELGFDGPTRNSLDAVGDRDFAIEILAAASLCAVHLSRIAEDLTLFASAEFGLVSMDDGVSSGSSIMPQKRNPDAAELIRGRCGRVIGAHLTLLVTVKGTPSGYQKDLQEDKPPLFEAMDGLSACLVMLARVLDGLEVDREACARAARGGYANATELADYLVGKGVPFRDAHEQVWRLVREAIERGAALEELPLDVLQEFCPAAGKDAYVALAIENALARRDVVGGTAPGRVAQEIDRVRARLDAG